MKRMISLIITIGCLLGSGAYAQVPITQMVIDGLCISQDGAAILADGTFILVGSDGSLAGTNPAKAVSVSPFGKINWELLDDFIEKSNQSYGKACALADGTVYATLPCPSGDSTTTILNRIENGSVISRTDLQTSVNVVAYTAGDSLIVCKESREQTIADGVKIYYPTLIGYDSQLQMNWTKEYDIPLRHC